MTGNDAFHTPTVRFAVRGHQPIRPHWPSTTPLHWQTGCQWHPADCSGRSFRQDFYLRRRSANEDAAAFHPENAERDEKLARLEAALLVAPQALSTRRLAQLAVLADAAEARSLVERLNAIYDACETAFRVERVAAGFRLMARPQFSRWLRKLHHRESQIHLSAPALETLTIIAYRQPIKRADIDSIRGVKSAEIIKQLMERGLAKIGGEEDTLGRPYLYVTTRLFLETFGLRTLDDLPDAAEMRQPQSEVHRDASASAAETEDEGEDDEELAADELSDEDDELDEDEEFHDDDLEEDEELAA